MTERRFTRRAAGYALWQWRRRTPSSSSTSASDRIRRSLGARERWSVVVLADRPSRWRLQRWMRTFFHDEVVAYTAGFSPSRSRQPGVTAKRLTTLSAVAAEVRSRPPVDLVVDLRQEADDDAQREAWRRLFLCVAPGGAYVHLDLSRSSDGAPPRGWARTVEALRGAAPDRLTRALIAATGSVDEVDGYAVHVKSRPHYLKVPDRRVQVLRTRTPDLAVDLLETLPASTVVSAAPAYGLDREDPTGGRLLEFTAPEATMRHYRGPVRVLQNMAVTHGPTLLPPSFRFPTEPVPTNVYGPDVTAEFATLPEAAELVPPRVEGDFFDLNTAFLAHFGHFITEVPAKLWGWDAAKKQYPQLRAILRIPADYEPTYERELLYAYGVREEDILWQREPVTVDSYISCTPLWQNYDLFSSLEPAWKDADPFWYHPAIRDVWDRIRAGLTTADREPGPARLFVTRPSGMVHRDCRNAPAVESLFAEYGFRMVRPEEHTLAEQAALFADATVVAGFGGSGMFNVLFAPGVRDVIALNHEAYEARNEHLYAAALGARSHTFWSSPDVPQRGQRHDPKAFHSTWAFDFARNEAALLRTLESLEP